MPNSIFWETNFEIWKHQCLYFMFYYRDLSDEHLTWELTFQYLTFLLPASGVLKAKGWHIKWTESKSPASSRPFFISFRASRDIIGSKWQLTPTINKSTKINDYSGTLTLLKIQKYIETKEFFDLGLLAL